MSVLTSCCGVEVTSHIYELEDPGSILGRTITQGLKIIEKKVLPLRQYQQMVRCPGLLGERP